MASPDDLDRMLALGAERPTASQCADPTAIDEADLLGYRRDTLDDDRRDAVEHHLVACSFCRALVANLEVEPKKSRWMTIAGVAAAAIAASVFLVVTPPPPPRDPIGRYGIAEVRGQISSQRAEAETEARVFQPDSQVAIKIEPERGRAATVVRVFRIDGGVLKPLDTEIESGNDGVFWIKGSGRQLFGDEAGKKRLVILAADPDADLSNVAGRPLASAQALTTQTAWLPLFDADYRLE
jgi:hypothetical protein